MSERLKKLLNSNKKCFKLVCGAGNECVDEVEKLVALYYKAGCKFFDISANQEIALAAKNGLKRVGGLKDGCICISLGIKGDPHVSKSSIDKNKCVQCRMCEHICKNNAVKNFEVLKERCIGCGKCFRTCPAKAIKMYSVEKDFDKILPKLINLGIDCIELHATTEDDEDTILKWKCISDNFHGFLSLCIDRMNLGNKQVLDRINNLIKDRLPFSTIIQADGIPMSGSDDRYKTTLQAVAMGEIIQDANLPVYIFLSGGTNTKTFELANLCEIKYHGISIGSYARKVVKPFIDRNDFFKNPDVFQSALEVAKRVVNSVK